MVAYFSINVTNKCNKACPYCVNKDYVNKIEYPDIIKFDDLKNWLEKEIKEDDIVEIAGTGEPTLCEWLPNLLQYLEAKKAWAILKTNGLKLGEWRRTLERLLVVLAKHDSSDEYILEQCKYLLPNDIICTVIAKEAMQNDTEVSSKILKLFSNDMHNIQRVFFITPDGKIRFMPCNNYVLGTVWDCRGGTYSCVDIHKCPFLVNAYNFIEYLKAPFDLPDGYNHVQVRKYVD